MPTRPRARKRVRAPRRGPDGSAFQRCDRCGVTVAVAVADMHECEPRKEVKRFKGLCGNVRRPSVVKRDSDDQPRSAFRIFMESFEKTREAEEAIQVDRMGFETWKKMSKEEREPFVKRASQIDTAHKVVLFRETNNASEMEDEADSLMVGGVGRSYPKWDEDYDESGSFGPFASFDTSD